MNGVTSGKLSISRKSWIASRLCTVFPVNLLVLLALFNMFVDRFQWKHGFASEGCSWVLYRFNVGGTAAVLALSCTVNFAGNRQKHAIRDGIIVLKS